MTLVSQLLFPPGLICLMWRADLQALPQREPVTPPPPQHWWSRRRWQHKRCPFPWGPHRPLLAPQEALSFQQCCQRDLPYPTASLIACPAGSFKQVNLKGASKMYLCKQCEKQTSSWDSMASHCLQEHLGIHVVCPQCGLSYSDPLKFHLHSRGSIICCFINFLNFFQFIFPEFLKFYIQHI